MAYEFSPQESIAAGVRRCAGEQIDKAVRALSEDIHLDPVEAVHTARKAIKKERALLRLAQGSLPAGRLARDNARLRDIGRTLSALRDADVMVETVEGLAERFSGRLPANAFTVLRDGLLAAGAAERDVAGTAALAERAVGELTDIGVEIGGWELRGDGWGVIRKGLKRTYRRGRKAFKEAHADPTAERLHAWRKRVKDHWYHLRLLSAVCGPIVAGAAQEADRLSDLLGDDHDLAVLSERLTVGAPELGPVDIDSIQPLIAHRREQLQTDAWQAGRRLYAERPAAFERRLHRLWKAGQTPRNLRTELV